MIFDQQDRFVRGFEDQKAPTIYPTSSGQELSIPHGQIHLDMPLGCAFLTCHGFWVSNFETYHTHILVVNWIVISHSGLMLFFWRKLHVTLEESLKKSSILGVSTPRGRVVSGAPIHPTHPRVPNDGCVQVKLAHRNMQDLNWGLLLSSQWCCVVSTYLKMELGPTSHEEIKFPKRLFASHSV